MDDDENSRSHIEDVLPEWIEEYECRKVNTPCFRCGKNTGPQYWKDYNTGARMCFECVNVICMEFVKKGFERLWGGK